jgi:hypothetical protein
VSKRKRRPGDQQLRFAGKREALTWRNPKKWKVTIHGFS